MVWLGASRQVKWLNLGGSSARNNSNNSRIVNLLIGLGCCYLLGSVFIYPYSTEAIIYRHMKEWEESNQGTQDHKTFCKALKTLIPKGSNYVSKYCLSNVLEFFDKYRTSFGYGHEINEIYFSIELRVYSKEDRIKRRMKEWHKIGDCIFISNLTTAENDKRLCKALTAELSEGSNDVSKDFLSEELASLDKYRASRYHRSVFTEICSLFEPRIYSREERIYKRMNEWFLCNQKVEEGRIFCQALMTELSTGLAVYPDFTTTLCRGLMEHKGSYAQITIDFSDFCKCVASRRDYSEEGWNFLVKLSQFVRPFSALSIDDPLRISTRDIIHNFLRDLPAEASDWLFSRILILFYILRKELHTCPTRGYRVSFPPSVWNRIDKIQESNPEICNFYRTLR